MPALLAAPADAPQRSPARATILIVEDEADLAEMLRFNLAREGYDCAVAGAGDEALAQISRTSPGLVILDRMLPGLSGDEVLARMQRDPATAHVPVLMLTAKTEEADELVGFALGAADYVAKPFSMKVLLARVSAILRRGGPLPRDEEDSLSMGPVTLCFSRHEALLHGRTLSATVTEFRILAALMRAGGRVLSRAQLLDTAFGSGVVVTDRTVDVHITALRKKLGASAAWVQTVRGVGYTSRSPERT
jgi:two-component system phosphate regulon response regulator PhoB